MKPTQIDGSVPGTKISSYWESAKKMLGDMNFLQTLIEFDKDHIAQSIIDKLDPYIKDPEFQPAKVSKYVFFFSVIFWRLPFCLVLLVFALVIFFCFSSPPVLSSCVLFLPSFLYYHTHPAHSHNTYRVSQAATSLCLWARAIHQYHNVLQIVKPKQEALRRSEEELREVMAKLQETKKQLEDMEAHIQSVCITCALDLSFSTSSSLLSPLSFSLSFFSLLILLSSLPSLQLMLDYEVATKKKHDLEEQVKTCENQLDRAKRLSGSLGMRPFPLLFVIILIFCSPSLSPLTQAVSTSVGCKRP